MQNGATPGYGLNLVGTYLAVIEMTLCLCASLAEQGELCLLLSACKLVRLDSSCIHCVHMLGLRL